MKQAIINFITFVKDTGNSKGYDPVNIPVKQADFVKILTKEFGIIIYTKQSHGYYIDPATAEEHGLYPPIWSSEIHKKSKWVVALSGLPNDKTTKKEMVLKEATRLKRENLFRNLHVPKESLHDFKKQLKRVETRKQKKAEDRLNDLFGFIKDEKELFAKGSPEEIKNHLVTPLTFPYCKID